MSTEKQMRELTARHNVELIEARTSHKKELESLREAHMREIETHKDTHQQQKQQLDKMKEDHAALCEALREQVAEAISAAAEGQKGAGEGLLKAKEDMNRLLEEKLREQASEASRQIDEAISQVKELKLSSGALEATNEGLKTELASQATSHADEVTQLRLVGSQMEEEPPTHNPLTHRS